VQSILDAMAKTGRFNVHSMQHSKSFLSGIFRVAIQQDFLDGSNPVRETSLPKTRRAEETYAYSLEEVFAMMAVVSEPASTMLCAAAFTGVRRGELRGLQWQDYNNGELAISRSVWHGIATDPKTEKSKAPIPIIKLLATKLAAHRERQGNPATGSIFPNSRGMARDPGAVLERCILPALNVCGVCSKPESEHRRLPHKYERNTVLPKWHGWHSFRRGLATNLNRLGVDDSVIQRILRHSNVSVTQKCYIKTVGDDARLAMQKLETALNDTNVTPKLPLQTPKAVM
jgi:integrase